MYIVQVYNGKEWETVFRSMDWGQANVKELELVKVHGWDCVCVAYETIV